MTDAPHADTPAPSIDALRRERGSSVVEYVGLGALSAMLVTGVAAALDSTHGDRIAVVIVRRLVEMITDSGG